MSLSQSSLIIICKDGLYGLQNKAGNIIVPCTYTNILDYDGDGYIRVLQGDVYGTVDFEGNIVIPHSLGLTHLGVFHQGAARARNAEGWGLVDEKGNLVTPFTYRHINAHLKNGGYTAYDADDRKGFLSDAGEFTPSTSTPTNKYPKRSKKFKTIGVFHNDVAPALNWKNRWVFVDKYLDQVNDFTYATLDKVLRDGLYSARVHQSTTESYYTAAYYDGTPFNDDHYDNPLHFENSLAQCCIKGKYGVVRADGTYLFPCQYDHIRWNDYDTKDCWFASDDKAAYLLYPDGVRRVYYKHQAQQKWSGGLCIPKKEIAHYISEEELNVLDQQIKVRDYELTEFDTEKYENCVNEYVRRFPRNKILQFYYRDTDAGFPIEELYKPGTIIRAGEDLEATQRLLRPIHRVRFLIVSTGLISVDEAMHHQRKTVNVVPPFRENIIHHNAYFMVYDVFAYMGRTQITLLQLPQKAIEVGLSENFDFTRLEASYNYRKLEVAARNDFMEKMSSPIHGHSLSAEWEEMMQHPIGLDENGELCTTKGYWEDNFLSMIFENNVRSIIDREFGLTDYNPYEHWSHDDFALSTGNNIEIVVGNSKYVRTDVLVCTDKSYFSVQQVTSDESDLPCKEIINVVVPKSSKRFSDEDYAKLASCYESSLSRATDHKYHRIVFPLLGIGEGGFTPAEAVSVAWRTVKRCLSEKLFSGTVIICCNDMETGEMFKRMQ